MNSVGVLYQVTAALPKLKFQPSYIVNYLSHRMIFSVKAVETQSDLYFRAYTNFWKVNCCEKTDKIVF